MNKYFTSYSFIIVLSVLFFGCGKPANTDTFGKAEMFTNYADNLILPAYNTYKEKIDTLHEIETDFSAAPDLLKLTKLQAIFLRTYAAWQFCEIYSQTSPANDIMALENTNYYPCRKDSIEAYIARNDNSVSFIKNKLKSDKGLAAIEYLLFSRTLTQQQILERFTTNPNAASYKLYLESLIANIAQIRADMVSSWSTYRQSFIENVGTDASSSFSVMVNSIAQRTDDLKRMQVGTPAGYLGNIWGGSNAPTTVQAYYSNNSITFMLLTLQDMKDVLNGKRVTDGKGLLDYIRTLNVSSTFGGNLADDILNQIDVCITKVNACGSDYAETVVNDKPKADSLFLETKKLLVLMKVDVPSAIGVSITYTDADGD
ncbi:MAG: imelysin family protein [Chitinophagales bacterium]